MALGAAGLLSPEPALAAPLTHRSASYAEQAAVPPIAANDGAPLSLQALRGRIVLINFWASWCVACRTELPSLERLAAKRRDLVVVAASVDADWADGIKAFRGRYPHLRLAFASLSDVQRFGALGMPYSVLLDPNGREARRVPRALDWAGPEGNRTLQSAR